MDYRQLNQLQQKKMDNVLDPDYVMEWEDSKLWIFSWETFLKSDTCGREKRSIRNIRIRKTLCVLQCIHNR